MLVSRSPPPGAIGPTLVQQVPQTFSFPETWGCGGCGLRPLASATGLTDSEVQRLNLFLVTFG